MSKKLDFYYMRMRIKLYFKFMLMRIIWGAKVPKSGAMRTRTTLSVYGLFCFSLRNNIP